MLRSGMAHVWALTFFLVSCGGSGGLGPATSGIEFQGESDRVDRRGAALADRSSDLRQPAGIGHR